MLLSAIQDRNADFRSQIQAVDFVPLRRRVLELKLTPNNPSILNDFVYIQWLVNATKDNEYPPLRLPLGDPSKLRHPMHVSHIRMIVEGSFLPKQSLSPSHLSSFLMQWPLSHWKRSEGHSLDLQLTSSLPSPQSSSWSHRHRSGMHWG